MKIVLESWTTGSHAELMMHYLVHTPREIAAGNLSDVVIRGLLMVGEYYDSETRHSFCVYKADDEGLEG